MDETKKIKFQEIIKDIDDLPTLPHVVIQLMEKINAPNPNVDELAEMIMTDQVLTTQMLRIVNSAFFGLTREISSVKETVVYLGLREIETLIYSATLTNTFEIDAPLMNRVKFWEHSFGCALYSRIIADLMNFPGKEMAYLAGLLHDIGESIIALKLYYKFEEIVEKVRNEKITFYQAEDQILGITHCDFGPWLVENWLMPAPISSVISYHHHVQEAKEHVTLVALVRLADLICLYNKLDFGHKENENIKDEIIMLWRLLSKESPTLAKTDIREFMKECISRIDSIKQTVEMVYSIQDDPTSKT